MLQARSVPEEHLYMSLHPCACGSASLEGMARGLRQEGGRLVSYREGPCPACGRPRSFAFEIPQKFPPGGALGGDAPSTIIDAGEFLQLSDGVARSIPADLEKVPPERRAEARARLRNVIAWLEEVIKFLPEGAERVPPDALRSEAARRLLAEDPGRFRRSRLTARLTAFRDLDRRWSAAAGVSSA